MTEATGQQRGGIERGGDRPVVERNARIINVAGLHARPVMKFVDLANRYQASVKVCKNTGPGAEVVDGKSPMEMMLLEAPQGTELHITATGHDAEELVNALLNLIAGRFGED